MTENIPEVSPEILTSTTPEVSTPTQTAPIPPAPSSQRVWKWYLVLAIINQALGIISGILFYMYPASIENPMVLISTAILGMVFFAWIIFDIVMLIIMLTKNIERIALWIPIITIFDVIYSMALTTILKSPSQSILLTVLTTIFPIIVLVLAIKLLARK